MSFDAYFEELKQGGTLDSTGVFTLNIEKLQGKLAQYQLANPRNYAQFLVRAANAVTADRISSTFVPQQSRIEIKNLCFRLEHFQNFSFNGPQSPAEAPSAETPAADLSAAENSSFVGVMHAQKGVWMGGWVGVRACPRGAATRRPAMHALCKRGQREERGVI